MEKLIDYKIEVEDNIIKFSILFMNEAIRFNDSEVKFKGEMIRYTDEDSGSTVYIGTNIYGPKLDIGFEDDPLSRNFAIYLRGQDQFKDNDVAIYECIDSETAQLFARIIDDAIDRYSKRFEFLNQKPRSIEEILKDMNIDLNENKFNKKTYRKISKKKIKKNSNNPEI